MKVSWFAGLFDNDAEVGDFSFTDFLTEIKPVQTLEKKGVRLFSPALFDGNRRKNDAVTEMHALVFDLDELQPADYGLIHDTLKSMGYNYLLYSTFSHHPNKPKLRIFIPLAAPIKVESANEWKRHLWFQAVHTFQVQHFVDGSAKDPARIYYVPCYHPDAQDPPDDQDVHPDVPWVVFEAFTEGKVFDPKDLVPYSFEYERATVSTPELADLHSAVAEYAGTLKRRKSAKTREIGRRIEHMLQGAQFAQPGAEDHLLQGRDNATFLMAAYLAEGFPTQPPERLGALFAESLKAMNYHTSGAPTVEDVVLKIERKQAEKLEERRNRERMAEEARGKLIKRAFGTDRNFPYTAEELESFGDMDHKWVIQHGRDYYIFLNGTYCEPISTMDEMQLNAERDLSPALHVNPWTTDRMGDPSEKSPREMLRQYGDVAEEVVYDLTQSNSSFEGRILRIAKPRPRDLEPEYDPKINHWLTLLGGEPLLNWLSVFYDLTRPLAGLYLANHKGAGKSLLAKGLVRRWGQAAVPVDATIAFGRFAASLLKCPFVFADEYLPKGVDTTVLRQAIQAGDREIDIKHKSPLKQNGHIRLMMAANNEYLISTRETLTTMDIEAINDRFLFIDVNEAPANYLEQLVRDGEDIDLWRTRDRITKHVLWLAENRKPAKTSRYLYGPIPTDYRLGPRLALASDATTELLEWVLRVLQEPEAVWAMNARIDWDENGMSVFPEVIAATWQLYMRGRRMPGSLRIAQALEPITETSADGTYHIPRTFIEQFNRKIGMFSAEDLAKQLEKE